MTSHPNDNMEGYTKIILKPFTSNTSYLLCMRLHVSALTRPSSGLLTNQVSKCCVHVGIPTMFTVGLV
jgi:hypothetical protein